MTDSTRESKQRSNERSKIPGWFDNFRLLRRLFNKWQPTDEQIKEIWFAAFNYQHSLEPKAGVSVDQDCLEWAIIEHRRLNPYHDPKFIELHDIYKIRSQALRREIDMARGLKARQMEDVERRRLHEKHLTEILTWKAERIIAAREYVKENLPNFGSTGPDPERWTAFYCGMIIAADDKIAKESKK